MLALLIFSIKVEDIANDTTEFITIYNSVPYFRWEKIHLFIPEKHGMGTRAYSARGK